MPLSRVALVGGPVPESPAEYVQAAEELERILAEAGVGIAGEGQVADGFIALPGGSATLAELFATCLIPAGPGSNEPPCGLLNTANFFSDQLQRSDDAVLERFARESQRGRLVVDRDPAALVRALAEYLPPESRRQSGAGG